MANLSTSDEERDLGVIISKDGKFGSHISTCISNANRKLGMLRNTFEYFNKDIAKILYPSLVRSKLEFGHAVWNPYLKGDIDDLEDVQKRATNTSDLRHLSYENRLQRLNLTSLYTRRIRGDLIQVYKIINKFDKIEWNPSNKIIQISDDEVGEMGRRNKYRLEREIVKNCPQRHNFLLNRTAPIWNQLPNEIVYAKSINSFKHRIDNFIGTEKWKSLVLVANDYDWNRLI